MTKRATLDEKKLMVKDSYIWGAPLPTSDEEDDEDKEEDEVAVDAAEKNTGDAGAPAEPPSSSRRHRKASTRHGDAQPSPKAGGKAKKPKTR
jgi:hypothetical protein